MINKIKTDFTTIVKAAEYSWQGLKICYKTELAFRQELFFAVLLTVLALWLGQTGLEKAVLIAVLLLVLIVELINTAIEFVVDRFGGETHEYSGIAKDAGSAAVFVSLVNVVVVWIIVLFF